MYTLYWSRNSASILVQVCLEEAGLPYDTVLVDLDKEAHRQADYLRINPAGKVPALVLPDGTCIGECVAMTLLIADQNPATSLAPAIGDPQRGPFLMWLLHLNNTLQPAMLRYYYADRFTTAADGIAGVREAATQEIGRIFERIDAHLAAHGPYLLGARFSAADGLCYMLSTWEDCHPGIYRQFPHVRRLAELVRARPAVARAAEFHGVGPVAA